MIRIAVIGAGAVGLSTAVQLQERLPSAEVTIIADKFNKDTTSDGAAGIFRPSRDKTPGVPMPVLRKWLSDSWRYYDKLAHSIDAGEAGVQITSGYHFYDKKREDLLDKEFIYTHRPCTEEEMNMFPGPKYKYGFFVTTLVTECRKYLPFLMRKFRLAGGGVENRTIASLEELVGKYDVVVNCGGFGNVQLVNDNKLIPIRGHLLRVNAPWIKHLLYTGDAFDCFIIPGADNVAIGGTREYNNHNREPKEEDGLALLEKASVAVPSLKSAKIERHWVGLGPFRNPLRLEKETLAFPTGSLKVVHNYGHGAEGISLSWGTGTGAVDLVEQLLRETPKAKL